MVYIFRVQFNVNEVMEDMCIVQCRGQPDLPKETTAQAQIRVQNESEGVSRRETDIIGDDSVSTAQKSSTPPRKSTVVDDYTDRASRNEDGHQTTPTVYTRCLRRCTDAENLTFGASVLTKMPYRFILVPPISRMSAKRTHAS